MGFLLTKDELDLGISAGLALGIAQSF